MARVDGFEARARNLLGDALGDGDRADEILTARDYQRRAFYRGQKAHHIGARHHAESEPKAELDRFCDAMIAIRREIQAVIEGKADRHDNVLKHAPHTAAAVMAADWAHPYSREQAAFPLPFVQANKIWPSVGRIDNP